MPNFSQCKALTGIRWVKFSKLHIYVSKFVQPNYTRRYSITQIDQLMLRLLSIIRAVPKSTVIDFFWRWIDLLTQRSASWCICRTGIAFSILRPLSVRQCPASFHVGRARCLLLEAATHGNLGINSRSHPQVSTSKYKKITKTDIYIYRP